MGVLQSLASRVTTVLGIDPGLGSTGWGVITYSPNNKYKFVDCGILKTEPQDYLGDRLVFINNSIFDLIKKFKPDKISIEKVFVNINPVSSEKLIMARTASFLAIAKSGHVCVEFTPNEIKKIVAGKGHGDKNLIKEAVQRMLNFDTAKNHCPKTADASDALAIALCLAMKELEVVGQQETIKKLKNKLSVKECKNG